MNSTSKISTAYEDMKLKNKTTNLFDKVKRSTASTRNQNKRSPSCYTSCHKQALTEYVSFGKADESANYITKRYGRQMFPYHCSICQHWHISPKKQKERKRRRCLPPHNKSITCFSKETGHALTEYECFLDASVDASFVAGYYGKCNVPYECDICGSWHLSPIERSNRCDYRCKGFCRGRSGRLKDAYKTKDDAARRADITLKERGVILYPYRCVHDKVWHLSSKNQLSKDGPSTPRITNIGRCGNSFQTFPKFQLEKL